MLWKLVLGLVDFESVNLNILLVKYFIFAYLPIVVIKK